MFLSAGINLRGLLTEQPELIAMKYDDRLLPSGVRRAKLLERLNELVAEGGAPAREPGLLLAYAAYQFGDRPAMEKGLAAMAGPAGSEPDQLARLRDVLDKVWTEPAPK